MARCTRGGTAALHVALLLLCCWRGPCYGFVEGGDRQADELAVDIAEIARLGIMAQEGPVIWKAVQYPVHLQLLIYKDKGSSLTLAGEAPSACLFNGSVRTTALKIQNIGSLICTFPTREVRLQLAGTPVTVEINGSALPTIATYPGIQNWIPLVYSAVSIQNSLLLFAKGIIPEHPSNDSIADSACVYGGRLSTKVTKMCVENILCELPPEGEREQFRGQPVALNFLGRQYPTAVLYDPDLTSTALSEESLAELHKRGVRGASHSTKSVYRHKVCACAMLWNRARLLAEWVIYHSYLGVGRFYIYDNNSDDNLEEVTDSLRPYNVTRHPWPWLKTHQAGFSHCAVRAQEECEWMLFIDVDEFLLPKRILADLKAKRKSKYKKRGRMVGTLMENVIREGKKRYRKGRVGRFGFKSHTFGPSGLASLPPSGQTVNYICSETKLRSQKSLVLLKAMALPYCGTIHLFDLKEGYEEYVWKDAVFINHYKFQVWEIQKLKYYRRAGTFTQNWRRDGCKTPLVSCERDSAWEPKMPLDWKDGHCQVKDRFLQTFVSRTFRRKNGKLVWEGV